MNVDIFVWKLDSLDSVLVAILRINTHTIYLITPLLFLSKSFIFFTWSHLILLISLCSSLSGCCWLCQGPPAWGSPPAATDLWKGERTRQRKRQGERWKEGERRPVLSVHPGAADPVVGQRNAGKALRHLQWSRCVCVCCTPKHIIKNDARSFMYDHLGVFSCSLDATLVRNYLAMIWMCAYSISSWMGAHNRGQWPHTDGVLLITGDTIRTHQFVKSDVFKCPP